MLIDNGIDNRLLSYDIIRLGFALLRWLFPGLFIALCLVTVLFFIFSLKVVNMETQHVAIINGVGDGVGVQLLLEDVGGGDHAGRFAFDGAVGGVLGKKWACR